MSKDWYINNRNGFYPSYCNKGKSKINLDDTLDSILFLKNKNIREKRIRDLISDVYEYLERINGFHFGVSEAFLKLKNTNLQLTSKNVVLEHAVPSKLVVAKMKGGNLNTRKDLLDFLKNHYFVCLITKAEDDSLRAFKLNTKMPKDWNDDWANWSLRYHLAGISLAIKPGLL